MTSSIPVSAPLIHLRAPRYDTLYDDEGVGAVWGDIASWTDADGMPLTDKHKFGCDGSATCDDSSKKLSWITIPVESTLKVRGWYSEKYTRELYDKWEKLAAKINDNAPAGCSNMWQVW